MICRSCGTEIADKAIVCYRCGAPTAEPAPRPAAGRGSPSAAARWAIAAVVLVIMAAAVLVVPRVPAGMPRVGAYAAVALVVFLVARAFGVGRRR